MTMTNYKAHSKTAQQGGANADNRHAGGGFDFYDFKRALVAQFGEQNANFFAMALHEQAGVILEQSSRFSKLADWCSKEIRQAGAILNTFSPLDKTQNYTQEQAKIWREQLQYAAELVYFYTMLCDRRTTNKQRENIEYAINKFYGIHYSEALGDYV